MALETMEQPAKGFAVKIVRTAVTMSQDIALMDVNLAGKMPPVIKVIILFCNKLMSSYYYIVDKYSEQKNTIGYRKIEWTYGLICSYQGNYVQ